MGRAWMHVFVLARREGKALVPLAVRAIGDPELAGERTYVNAIKFVVHLTGRKKAE